MDEADTGTSSGNNPKLHPISLWLSDLAELDHFELVGVLDV
jgi:hypothetical protein